MRTEHEFEEGGLLRGILQIGFAGGAELPHRIVTHPLHSGLHFPSHAGEAALGQRGEQILLVFEMAVDGIRRDPRAAGRLAKTETPGARGGEKFRRAIQKRIPQVAVVEGGAFFHGELLTVSTLVVNVDIVNLRHANPATGNGAPRIEIPTSVGRISLSVEGTAERAVFLWPSLFSDLHLYDLVVPLLGSDWRIIRVDGPGFGASERPRPNTQPEHYADAVVELLDALGQKKTFFAGTSWGGQIGAHLACRHPKRIEALLMMNTPLEPSVGGHLMKLFLTRWFVSSAFFASGVARAFFAPATLRGAPEVVRAFTARFAGFEGRAAATTVATTLRAFPGGEGILPQITAPTTVLLGELDRLGSPESLERIARKIPGARIEILPGCGHLAPLEAPQAVARAINELASRTQK